MSEIEDDIDLTRTDAGTLLHALLATRQETLLAIADNLRTEALYEGVLADLDGNEGGRHAYTAERFTSLESSLRERAGGVA